MIISNVICYTREGWLPKGATNEDIKADGSIEAFRKLAISLSTAYGCLLYGSRVVIPPSLQPQVLQLLHLGHFGMQNMKQLARTAVHWLGIDTDIMNLCHRYTACAEHQKKPPKPANHPWMLPEKPWSRDQLPEKPWSRYPCIHPTTSTYTKSTTDLLEQDFAHFGYPHTIVSDNATSFSSSEFQSWCRERGITHLTGAPYHPATNGATERLVQTFKQALSKSSLPSRATLQEFLIQYCRTPRSEGYSPSELLNVRQIRTKIDVLLPSPAHAAQGESRPEKPQGLKLKRLQTGCLPYNLLGHRAMHSTVVPGGRRTPGGYRLWSPRRPRYGAEEDADPGEVQVSLMEPVPVPPLVEVVAPTADAPAFSVPAAEATRIPAKPVRMYCNPRLPTGSDYSRDNSRRSARQHQQINRARDNVTSQ
eukprot:Em0020g731a